MGCVLSSTREAKKILISVLSKVSHILLKMFYFHTTAWYCPHSSPCYVKQYNVILGALFIIASDNGLPSQGSAHLFLF